MKSKEWIASNNLRFYVLAWSRIKARQFSLGVSADYHAGKTSPPAAMNLPAWLFIEVALIIVTVQFRMTVGKQDRVELTTDNTSLQRSGEIS